MLDIIEITCAANFFFAFSNVKLRIFIGPKFSDTKPWKCNEFNIDWQQNYIVDVDNFDEDAFNQGFNISDLPLTSEGLFVEGELYLHHKIDITDSINIITSDLPSGVEFAIAIPESSERIEFIELSSIDRIARPWDWCDQDIVSSLLLKLYLIKGFPNKVKLAQNLTLEKYSCRSSLVLNKHSEISYPFNK